MILELATSPDFFVEMAWKSAAISGVALAALALLRSRSATDRAAVVRLAVVLLLALPVVSLTLPALQVEKPVVALETARKTSAPTPPASQAPVADPVDSATDVGLPADAAATKAAPLPAPAGRKLPTGLMLTIGYAAGALLLALRLLIGLWTLRRWTAAADPVADAAWAASLRRARAAAGVSLPVRLLVSADTPSPLSWGLRAPVILIDYDTLDRGEDADAVLAHEMAHVGRRDWAMLMLSRLAVALFWFNPLVWLLERALVQQAEEAADLRALGGVEALSYARTLVACGAHAGGRLLPANSIAGQGLARRVRAVLDETRRATPSGSAWTGMAMLLCIAVSGPIAALELVAPKAPRAPRAPVAAAAPRAPAAPVAPAAASAPAAPSAPVAPAAPAAPSAAALDEAEIALAVAESRKGRALSDEEIEAIEEAAEAAAEAAADRAEAEAEAAADRAEAAAEAEEARAEAEAARVEAEAARVEMEQARAEARAAAGAAVRAAGRARASAVVATATKAGPLTVDDLVAMKIQGIDARYLTELAALAPRIRLSAKEVVAAKIQGLTPARLREFADAGYAGADIDDLIAMRIHDVTPRFIAEMTAAGYPKLSPDDLVAMRIHGISAAAARRGAAQGRRPTPDELIEMRLRGKI